MIEISAFIVLAVTITIMAIFILTTDKCKGKIKIPFLIISALSFLCIVSFYQFGTEIEETVAYPISNTDTMWFDGYIYSNGKRIEIKNLNITKASEGEQETGLLLRYSIRRQFGFIYDIIPVKDEIKYPKGYDPFDELEEISK